MIGLSKKIPPEGETGDLHKSSYKLVQYIDTEIDEQIDCNGNLKRKYGLSTIRETRDLHSS